MKSLTAFSHVVLQELGDRCRISTIRDSKTITERIEHEGLSFLTITLPSFGKDLQRALEERKVDRSMFTGFRRGHGELPRFLGGFLGHVFDEQSGVLLDAPCLECIRSLHQLTSMFGKVLLPTTERRTAAAFRQYVETEQEVRRADRRVTPDMSAGFTRIASLLFRDVFTDVDLAVYNGELVPKHGPGATADRLLGNQKYNVSTWTARLEEVFPAREMLIPNERFSEELESVDFLEPGAEMAVRVISVPKTLKTPRIIAVEPTAVQYAQQALRERLYERLEADHLVSPLIGFTDQIPNRDLAREGSLYGELATLDLSEASDRVSNQLVRALTLRWPHLTAAVDASRSRKADVPGHGVIRLAKFASMGSALCFPMEAMVFLTIIGLSLEQVLERPVTRADLRRLHGKVRVYGDDIIVPVDMVRPVIDNLEAFGLKVNSNKSFWTGKFRESCGGDFYDGHWITPVRVRRVFPTSRADAEEIISMVSLRNQLFQAGFDATVEWLDSRLERLLGRFPWVHPDSPALGRWAHDGRVTVDRVSKTLHRPMVKAYVAVSVLPVNPLDGHGALMKYFLKRGDLPVADREHLLRSGRPLAVDIRQRWVPAD